jgi:ATP-dependent DNA helicase RecG
MDDQELTTLLQDLESDRVERKASFSDGKKIRQAICAFANDLANHQKPGVLFVGVEDKGTCANLPISDQLLTDLAGIRSEGKILPFPVLQVEKKIINGCELAVVIVQPAEAPPVRFDGRTWIRVGPRRAIATPEEERRLNEKRRYRDLPFDLHPFKSASLNDLNLDIFQQYLNQALAPDILEANQRSLEQQLISLRFLTLEPDSYPTNLGILVTGKDPRQFIPGFYLQFARFDGTEITDPVRDQKEISGSLVDLLRYTDEVLEVNISTASDFTSQATEIKKPDYPIVALQQLVRNAIMHRSYEATYAPVRVYWFSDRIEIFSPGGLFGQVNPQNFGRGGVTGYRNPHLAEAMKNLGYVQRFGAGIPLAQKELQKNGNPPAEFTLEDSYILVTIRKVV